MGAYLEVMHRDGTIERHALEDDQVYVGRSPRSGIAIPEATDLEPEHLVLSPQAQGCWVGVARGGRVGASLGGKPFHSGVVPWGSELEVGPLRLRLTDQAPAVPIKGESTVSLPVLLAAVGLLALAVWMFVSGDERDSFKIRKVEAPELFPAPKPCPEQGAAATALARETAEAAAAKAERYPFAPKDGVEAVELYGVAASCYAQGGDEGEAQRLENLRKYWQGKVSEDFKTRRLRLERALKERQYRDALNQAYALLRFLEGRADPYTTWLMQLRRQLDLRLAGKKKG